MSVPRSALMDPRWPLLRIAAARPGLCHGYGGGAARRLTYNGKYNTNPAFSPKGDQVAYQSREGSGFNIYRIPPRAVRRLP